MLINRAFFGKALGKSLCVSAVIVNHVVVLHPFEFLFAAGIQSLIEPITSRGWAWSARRFSRRPDTSFGIKVPVRGRERSFAPVCLDKSASCSPVVGIPDTWLYPHRLVFWKWDAHALQVFELSNRCPIDRETEMQ